MVLDIPGIFNVYVLVEAVWLILPAYAANGLVPLFRGKRRLDFGKKFIDGRPLLGPGKTIEGLFFGAVIGAAIGLVEMTAFPYLPWEMSDVPLRLAVMTPALGFLLGLGAMVGDSAGSFIKRRLKLERGQKAPLLDQLDFFFGAIIFASAMTVIRPEWVILMTVLTPIFHYTACVIGYALKVKREPW
jgi:CDP-2,3-bis-(O-geranylgeranyl)-sn-glycerol synthase